MSSFLQVSPPKPSLISLSNIIQSVQSMQLLLMQFSPFSSILHMLTHKMHATLQDIITQVTSSENCIVTKCPNINCRIATSTSMAVTEHFKTCFITMYNTENNYLSGNAARGEEQLRTVVFSIRSSFLLMKSADSTIRFSSSSRLQFLLAHHSCAHPTPQVVEE